MEDRQQFIDGLTQLRANAGLGNWIVERDKTWFIVKSVVEDGPDTFIAETISEDVADFIATNHAIIPELVEVIGAALDEADRLDEEKDDLIAQIFDLEVIADVKENYIEELRSDISDLEGEVDSLNSEIYGLEEDNSDLRDEVSTLRAEVDALNEQLNELENE